jgi:hypothetical protein
MINVERFKLFIILPSAKYHMNYNSINILPLIEGIMVHYHTQKTNIIRDEVEGDIVVFWVW